MMYTGSSAPRFPRQLFAIAAIALLASAPSGWNHKAVSDDREASKFVGAFSPEQARLYHDGLLHVLHLHQTPGRYTIREVVQGERARATARQRKRNPTQVGKPRTSSAAPDSGNPGGVLLFFLVVGGVITAVGFSSASKRKSHELLLAHNTAVMDDIKARATAGALAPIQVPINLAQDEQCFFEAACSYAVMANVDHGSTGVGVSIRVARGVRVGSYHRLPTPKDLRMVSEDGGTLFLTDKHLIFVGSTVSVSFTWSRVLKVTPFVDGVRYEISNHRPIQFRTGDIAASFMSAVLQDGLYVRPPKLTERNVT